jgi:von Willebrand factor A domain-containing protein 7
MRAFLQYLLFALFLLTTSHAFMPWDWRENLVGKHGTSHEKMTRDAFKIMADKYWPTIPDLTVGMIQARDTIANANGNVDGDQKHSAKHFDGENFDGGQYVLTGNPVAPQSVPLDASDINLFQQILDALDMGSAEDARTALGKALHTIQDFYAHSNWVELGHATPHPGIGRPGPLDGSAGPLEATCTTCGAGILSPADQAACETTCVLPTLLDAARAVLTESILLGIKSGAEGLFAKLCVDDCQCNDCSHNIITGGLTSGYYHGEDRSPPDGVMKCRHGGDFDNAGADLTGISIIDKIAEYVTGAVTSPTEGINKDSLDCGWSSHFGYHQQAVDVALQATEQFIDDIKAAITTARGADIAEQQMRLLFGVGPILAFVVDTTGSMGDVIAAVSAQLISIVNERIGTLSEPSRYILTPFNDPADPLPFATVDPTLFKQALGNLFAVGGGDCPEPSMEGLLTALLSIDPGADVFLITDATSKDPGLLSQVVQIANSKKIHVYTFLFDSGCSDVGVYFDLAVSTNGGFFPLGRGEAGLITQQVDFWLQPDLTPVASFSNVDISYGFGARRIRREVTSFDIPVDGFTSVIQFSVKGTSVNASVARPDHSVVVVGDPGVTISTLSTATFITIDSPPPGTFTVTISAPGNFTLDVYARSPIHFSFDFASFVGRPDHSGWGPDSSIVPTPGVDIPALAKLDGGTFSDVKFQIRSPTGAVLTDDLPFIQGGGEVGQPGNDTFFGFVNLPPVSSLIYVTGLDSSGKEFIRIHPIVFIPSLSAGNVSNTTTANSTRSVYTSTSLSTIRSGSSIPIKPSSAPFSHEKSMGAHLSGVETRRTKDIHTAITTTITKPCPYESITVEGHITKTITETSYHTTCVTFKSVLPCEVCLGANYGGPKENHGVHTTHIPGGNPAIKPVNSPTCTSSAASPSNPKTASGPTGGLQVFTGGASGPLVNSAFGALIVTAVIVGFVVM